MLLSTLPLLPNKAWSSVSNLSQNRKKIIKIWIWARLLWRLIESPLQLAFIFFLNHFGVMESEKTGLESQLYYVTASWFFASSWCLICVFLYHPLSFLFLFFLFFLFSSSTAWWLKACSLEPDMYLGFSTYYLCDLGQVTQVFYGSVSSSVFVVQSLSCIRLFATSWTVVCQASLSFTISQSWLELTSTELMMPSNHLLLCHPLLLLPSIFPSIRVFSSESALPIRWPKC